MDVIYHSEIGTSHTMIEVMNHIKVLLKSTGRSEYILSQGDECVTAMNSIPPGEIMCQVHIADQSDKAPATKGIEAWKYFRDNQYQGYNHVPNIVLPVTGLFASQLMTINRDGASQLLNASPANRFNESISQKQREESLPQVVSGVYNHSNVFDDASETRTEILTSKIRVHRPWGYRRSFPVRYSGGSCLTMQHNPSRAYHLRVQATFEISDC